MIHALQQGFLIGVSVTQGFCSSAAVLFYVCNVAHPLLRESVHLHLIGLLGSLGVKPQDALLAAAAHQLYLATAAMGHGAEDDAAVVKYYAALAGLSLPTGDKEPT